MCISVATLVENSRRYCTAHGMISRRGSWQSTYLFAFAVNAIKNRLISRLGESRLLSGLLVISITGTETLWAEVESIAERLVDACECFVAGHEDLQISSVISSGVTITY